jgi:hypothetical protein
MGEGGELRREGLGGERGGESARAREIPTNQKDLPVRMTSAC